MWSQIMREVTRHFLFFRNLRKLLLAIFLSSESSPNVFSMPLLFLKAILLWKMSCFPNTLVYRSQTVKKTLRECFLVYVFPLHQARHIKEQFLLIFRHPNLPTRFKYIRKSRLHWALSPLLVQHIRLVRSGYIFFYRLLYPDIFYLDSYGIDIRCTSAKCKHEAYLDKKLSYFVPIQFSSA